MPITMNDWIAHIESEGWSLHMSGGANVRWYIRNDSYASLKVTTDEQGLVTCEVSAFLPNTFIQVTSRNFAVSSLERYKYVSLLASRIDHACCQYVNGAP